MLSASSDLTGGFKTWSNDTRVTPLPILDCLLTWICEVC